MNNLRFPYARADLNKNDIKAVLKVLETQYLAQGQVVKKFEEKLKNKFDVSDAIICNSGTAALHSVYRSLGLNNENGIITTPITFLATANAARMCNAPVFFTDVDSKSGLMTPKKLQEAFNRVKFKVKAVVVVHLGGHLCDLEGLSKVAKKYNSFIIEDACHALGALHYGKKNSLIGSCKYSLATTFSFHAIKNITMGEGGAITTNNSNLANKIKLNISHGMIRNKREMINPPKDAPWYYQMKDIGWNYRASEISCALGLSQFKRINKIIEKRDIIANLYKNHLAHNEYISLPKFSNRKYGEGWHLFQLNIDFKKLKVKKQEFIKHLRNHSIGSQVHYIPLVYQPYYSNNEEKKFLIEAATFYNNTISIPMYTGLNKKNVRFIAKVINNFFNITN
ncbi:MAG: hypothetical protein CBC22_03675 [Alphaproteobacteria bacterium TMED62]|nr:MAG: hypothetical protein CBC22_03675 [Alphaproteobacteria bacterium TMED62]|tara:strand:- start:13628 stop:14812 length:1185 start_codon:yes stop_codon:yes gene_type:complete